MATKILAIDDSKTMRLAVKITFAAEDADVTSVSKGSDAVARAKQLSPDVILVDADLGAGEASGYDVCQQLKNDAATKQTPVVLMVSNQTGVDQARYNAAGADGFVNKPFDTQELIDTVGGVVGKPVASAEAVTAAPAPAAAAPAPAVAAPAPAVAAPAPRPAPAPAPAPAKPAPRPAPAAAKPAPAPARPAPRPAPKPAVKPAAAVPPVRGAAPKPAVPAAAISRPAPAAGGAIPVATPIPFTAADSPTAGMLKRLQDAGGGAAGLDPAVAQALLSLSREVIEAVVWEVVPELAEEIIKKQAQSA